MSDILDFNLLEERLMYFGVAMYHYTGHELPFDWNKVQEYSALRSFTTTDMEKRFQFNLLSCGYFSLGGLQTRVTNYLESVSAKALSPVEQYRVLHIEVPTPAEQTVFTSIKPLYNVELRSIYPNGCIEWNPQNVQNLRELINYGSRLDNPKPLAHFNSWEWKEQAEVLNLADSRTGEEIKEDFIAFVSYHLEQFPTPRYGQLLKADGCDKSAGIAIFHRLLKTVMVTSMPSPASKWDRTRFAIVHLLAVGAIYKKDRDIEQWMHWFIEKLFHDPIGPALFNANETAFSILRMNLLNEAKLRPWGITPGMRYLQDCAGLM